MSFKNIRLLCLDPALSICGWSVIDIRLELMKKNTEPKISVNRFGCIKSNMEAVRATNRDQVSLYGKQIFSLGLLRDNVAALIEEFQPDHVIIEDAFYNPKMPNAFASLLQCICVVAMLCRDRFNKTIHRIPTRSAKQTIFGSGGANKQDVISAVLNCEHIVFKQKKNSINLTEHEADSIAIGYHFAIHILPGLNNITPTI
jgi:Holliday junction resolvasome RuvABC endonuclease subunit